MAFTKVVGPGIHTLAQLRTHNIHSAGIITATKFVGEMESGGGSSTFQDVTVSGNLTVQGDTTTLNTTLRNVELLRVAATSNTTAGIITQTGTGDVLNLFDASTEVMTVVDGGEVGIGITNPGRNLHVKSTTPYIRVESGAANQPATLELYHTRGNGSDKWPVSVATDDAALTFNVAAAANGSPAEKVRIESGGDVGIGTNNPTNKLHLYEDGTNSASFKIQNHEGATTLQADGDAFHIDAGAHYFRNAAGDTNRIIITSGGDVNVGAAAGNTTIHASGLFNGATPKFEVKLGAASNSYTRLINITNPGGQTGSESLGRVGIKLSLGSEASSGESNKSGAIYAESTSTYNNATALCLATNNEERLRITSGGYVGIGTDKPNDQSSSANNLVVADFGGEGGITIKTNVSSSGNIFFADTAGTATGRIAYGHGATDAGDYMRFYVNSEEKLRIKHDGNVGIGTHNPAGKLEIDTASSTDMIMLDVDSTNFAKIGHNSSSGVAVLDIRSEGHTRFLTNGDNEYLRIKNDGDLLLQGGKIYGEDAASNTFTLQSTSGNVNHSRIEIGIIDNSDNGGIHFYTAGSSAATQRMMIKGTNGYVGINTNSALKAPLHVGGGGLGAAAFTSSPYNKVAIFGAKGWVSDTRYHYTDATICITGRNNAGIDTGAGIEFTTRTVANNNWRHGAITFGQDGIFRVLNGGAGVTEGTQKFSIATDGQATFTNKVQASAFGAGTVPDDHMGIHILQTNPRILIKSSGTNAAKIFFGDSSSNDPGVIEYAHSSNTMFFGTNNDGNRLAIDSAGNVMIGGTTTTSYPVDISFTNDTAYSATAQIGNAVEIHNLSTTAGTTAGVHMYVTGNGANAAAVHLNAVHTANGSGAFTVGTRHDAGQHIERFRITSDGKIGIGEDDPDDNYLLIRAATTVGTNKGHIMLTGDSATVGQGPQIVFSESGSGSSYAGAYVGHEREGSNSTGALVFGTRSTGGDASTVPDERLRIDSNGRIAFGGLTASNYYSTYDDFVWGATSGSVGMTIVSGSDSAGYLSWADGTSGADQYRGRLYYSHDDNGMHFRTNGTAADVLHLKSNQDITVVTGEGKINGRLQSNSGSGGYNRTFGCGLIKKDLYIYGDSAKYYPVEIIPYGSSTMTHLAIYRAYSEHGPSDWNTASHKGGLTLEMMTRVGGWGGYTTHGPTIFYLGEVYATLLGGMAWTAHTQKYVIWLRGGGVGGALYHIESSNGNIAYTIHDDTSHTGTGAGYYYSSAGTAGQANNSNTARGWSTYYHSNTSYRVYTDYIGDATTLTNMRNAFKQYNITGAHTTHGGGAHNP